MENNDHVEGHVGEPNEDGEEVEYSEYESDGDDNAMDIKFDDSEEETDGQDLFEKPDVAAADEEPQGSGSSRASQ